MPDSPVPELPFLARRRRLRLLLLMQRLGVIVFAAAACASPSPPPASQPQPAPLTTTAETLRRPSNAPRLVVAVVIDQLGAEALLRAERWMEPSGGIGQAMRSGLYYERARYPYAATLTGPGHATLFSGVPPRHSGVSANERWESELGAAVASTYDASAKVLGSDHQAGPAALEVESVGDALERQTQGQGRVLALSVKDRGAIFSAGRAGLALWFDAAAGGFTTSTAYRQELPEWLLQYQAQHPIQELLVPWHPLDAQLYAQTLGPDDAPGEASIPGFGASFPHDPANTGKPLSLLRATPQMSDYLFDLAQAAVSAHALGADAVPDLLIVSVSGLDYTGHIFGPDSWEYIDHLRRIDRRLASFAAHLQQLTSVVVLVTADHGVMRLPEQLPAGATGGRVFVHQLHSELNQALTERFGAGPAVKAMLGAFVYLNPAAKQHSEAEQITAFAREWLTAQRGVADVVAVAQLRGQEDLSQLDARSRAVALSLGKDVLADLYVVQAEGYLLDEGVPPGSGSHHGSPYPYDSDVPVLVFGNDVHAQRLTAPVNTLQVAPTLAELLGIQKPSAAKMDSLLPR